MIRWHISCVDAVTAEASPSQIDRLVQLLETPVFTRVRLQLLQPTQHPALIQCAPALLRQSFGFAVASQRNADVLLARQRAVVHLQLCSILYKSG